LQDGAPDATAIQLLSDMASLGGGVFKNFPNGDSIDFRDFDVRAIARDYRVYSPIVAYNLTARLEDVDSDSDGLTDAEEQELGTDPTRRDTDGDGCGDLMEVRYQGWDATVPG